MGGALKIWCVRYTREPCFHPTEDPRMLFPRQESELGVVALKSCEVP